MGPLSQCLDSIQQKRFQERAQSLEGKRGMIETPEPPHQHHKTGVRWFDLIMPLAVLCISFGALLNSLQSERSMQALVEQNRRLVDAQSTPLLMLDTAYMSR